MNRLKQIYRWVRFRHGFGVHSPYAFSFINDVLEEKNGYYGYLDIATKMSMMQLKSSFTKQYSLKYHLLLFRIGHFFRPKNIIFFGHEITETILYLRSTHRNAKCLLIETGSPKLNGTKSLLDSEISFRSMELNGNSTEDWLNSIREETAEIYYFHRSIEKTTKQKLVEYCLQKKGDASILFLFDYTNHSTQEKEFWNWLKNNPQVTITFDLIRIGIAIYHPKLIKQNYRLPY